MTLLANLELSQPQHCRFSVAARTCGLRTPKSHERLGSLLQTLCWNRIWSKGLSTRCLGLQKAKREQEWLSEPSNKEFEGLLLRLEVGNPKPTLMPFP